MCGTVHVRYTIFDLKVILVITICSTHTSVALNTRLFRPSCIMQLGRNSRVFSGTRSTLAAGGRLCKVVLVTVQSQDVV